MQNSFPSMAALSASWFRSYITGSQRCVFDPKNSLLLIIDFRLQIWTFDHLVGAHSQSPPREQAKGRVLAHMQNVFSIPKNTNADSKKRLAFSLFYSAATTYPLVVTTTYWLYLFPMGFQADPPIWPRLLQYFLMANYYIVNSIIAIVEVMLLSSVQVQKVANSLPCRTFTDI